MAGGREPGDAVVGLGQRDGAEGRDGSGAPVRSDRGQRASGAARVLEDFPERRTPVGPEGLERARLGEGTELGDVEPAPPDPLLERRGALAGEERPEALVRLRAEASYVTQPYAESVVPIVQSQPLRITSTPRTVTPWRRASSTMVLGA